MDYWNNRYSPALAVPARSAALVGKRWFETDEYLLSERALEIHCYYSLADIWPIIVARYGSLWRTMNFRVTVRT